MLGLFVIVKAFKIKLLFFERAEKRTVTDKLLRVFLGRRGAIES